MVLQFRPDEATAMWAGGGPGTPLPLPTDFQLVAPLVVGRRLYLVGAHEFLELNLERAMRAAFEAHFGASSP